MKPADGVPPPKPLDGLSAPDLRDLDSLRHLAFQVGRVAGAAAGTHHLPDADLQAMRDLARQVNRTASRIVRRRHNRRLKREYRERNRDPHAPLHVYA